jgi:hypothetical protein
MRPEDAGNLASYCINLELQVSGGTIHDGRENPYNGGRKGCELH